jgi:hypothetical protein
MSLLPSVANQVSYRTAIGAGCALGIAAVVGLVTSSPARLARRDLIATPVIAEPEVRSLPVALPPPPAPAAPEVHSDQLMFVFQAGGATYLKIADLRMLDDAGEALPVPKHGKLRLATDDYVDAAIAPVADRDVPQVHLVWKDRKVKVDGSCEANVAGFAVVARVVGEPSYAGMERWTAAGVMKTGHIVLAARLDRCKGSFARDATLSDVVIPARLHDPELEAAARAALIASEPARDTQREWDEQTTATGGDAGPWHEDATMPTEVLRHPRTGATFVSVHGHVQGGCGAPQANVWGLFRVDHGQLVPVQLRQLGEIEAIDALIDVDGDGELEILGKPWLGYDALLTRANGEALDQLTVPFVGCPC